MILAGKRATLHGEPRRRRDKMKGNRWNRIGLGALALSLAVSLSGTSWAEPVKYVLQTPGVV